MKVKLAVVLVAIPFLIIVRIGMQSVAADQTQTWVGEIGDLMCAGNHKVMGSKPARECTLECVKSMGSKYILVTDKGAYFELSDQKTPEAFAGRKVKVTGTLDSKGKVIQVKSIEGAS
jgi:hypothetical protein